MEMVSKKVVCVALLCMVVIAAAPGEVEALTCGQISSGLAQCIPYLQNGGKPSTRCCAGVKGLVAQARTPADRKDACNCLKQASGSIRGINMGYAAALPGQCGASIPYKISPSTDCNKVQ